MKRFKWFSSFLPWIVSGVLSFVYPDFALPLGIVSFVFSYTNLKKGFILDWGSLLFFISSWLNSAFFHHVWWQQHHSIIITFFFSALSMLSLVINKPFTLQYAKYEVEKEKQSSPHFFRINQWMTAGFGFIFLILAMVTLYRAYYPDVLTQVVLFFIWAAGLIVKIIFVRRFPKWYLKRVAK